MKNTFAYTIVFTFVLCFLFVLVLSFIDASTQDIIQANRRFTEERAILLALGAHVLSVQTPKAVTVQFAKVDIQTYGDTQYYKANFSSPAIAKKFSGPGLWGLISGYIAFSNDMSKVVGFEVTAQNETPGLGARVTEPWFKEQLYNEKIKNNTIVVGPGGSGDTDKENGMIDGISGATRTSEGVQIILDQEIKALKDIIKAKTRFTEQRAILLALGADLVDVETPEAVTVQFAKVDTQTRGDTQYYKGNFGKPAIAKKFVGDGLWGLISGYIALSNDMSKVVGFEVTDHSETPGIGARITEPWFKEQLYNEKIKNNTIVVGPGGSGDTDKENGMIDGISGATGTSDGVQTILNQEIKAFYKDGNK